MGLKASFEKIEMECMFEIRAALVSRVALLSIKERCHEILFLSWALLEHNFLLNPFIICRDQEYRKYVSNGKCTYDSSPSSSRSGCSRRVAVTVAARAFTSVVTAQRELAALTLTNRSPDFTFILGKHFLP